MMEKLHSGEFFGVTDQKLTMAGTILTNTAYTHDYVDWHDHENAYFTFLLSGKVIEGNKKGKIQLNAGSLLFHNAQESHYNIKPKGETRGMHLEIKSSWLKEMFPAGKIKEGSFEITCQQTKLGFYKILKESKVNDGLVELGIQQLMISATKSIFSERLDSKFRPMWIDVVAELLQDTYLNPPSLSEIAMVAGVHPVHLSRSFSKYFNCTMAEYIRLLKVERALSQLAVREQSLSSIAYNCGFADQSHMIRCFREIGGDTPLFFRKLICSLPAG